MDERSLLDQNPWWKDINAIESDKHILDLKRSKIKWHPRMMDYFDWNEDLVYTIRGPRQVGKTTTIKMIIRNKLLEKGVKPFNILYYSMDLLDTKEQFMDLIVSYEELSKRFSNGERKYLFLDEITNVIDWERVIKLLSDQGRTRNRTIVLTGSHSIDIGRSLERLPGRRGEGSEHVLDKILMPIKFREYANLLTRVDNHQLEYFFNNPASVRMETIQKLLHGTIPDVIKEISLFEGDSLKTLFENYLITGGLPRPISLFKENSSIQDDIYGIYVRSVLGDISGFGLSDNITKQILRSVIGKMTSKISNNSIAKENEIGSHNTVHKYLESLERSFVLNTFYQVDLHKNRIKTRSEKKIYISDPFIYHSLRGWAFGINNLFRESVDHLADSDTKGKIVEMVISNHLIRMAYSLAPSDLFSHHEKVLFWRKKGSEKEVDFLSFMKDEVIPIEVKYSEKIRDNELSGIKSFGKGMVITKDLLEIRRNLVLVPAHIFLLLI
jgi:hypothetical protein